MWAHTDYKLNHQFKFAGFSEEFAFMTRVAMVAEQQNHHLLRTNMWNQVDTC